MQKARKLGPQVPDISLFVPSLKDQLEDREARGARAGAPPSSWEPRSTILFSLSVALVLWTGIAAIVWLICTRHA